MHWPSFHSLYKEGTGINRWCIEIRFSSMTGCGVPLPMLGHPQVVDCGQTFDSIQQLKVCYWSCLCLAASTQLSLTLGERWSTDYLQVPGMHGKGLGFIMEFQALVFQ